MWIIITKRADCGQLNYWFFTNFHHAVEAPCVHEVFAMLAWRAVYFLTSCLQAWLDDFLQWLRCCWKCYKQKLEIFFHYGFPCLCSCGHHKKSMPWVAVSAWPPSRIPVWKAPQFALGLTARSRLSPADPQTLSVEQTWTWSLESGLAPAKVLLIHRPMRKRHHWLWNGNDWPTDRCRGDCNNSQERWWELGPG